MRGWIIGFGDLGDMAAKPAKAINAEVVLFTTKEKIEGLRSWDSAVLESGWISRFRYVIDIASLRQAQA